MDDVLGADAQAHPSPWLTTIRGSDHPPALGCRATRSMALSRAGPPHERGHERGDQRRQPMPLTQRAPARHGATAGCCPRRGRWGLSLHHAAPSVQPQEEDRLASKATDWDGEPRSMAAPSPKRRRSRQPSSWPGPARSPSPPSAGQGPGRSTRAARRDAGCRRGPRPAKGIREDGEGYERLAKTKGDVKAIHAASPQRHQRIGSATKTRRSGSSRHPAACRVSAGWQAGARHKQQMQPRKASAYRRSPARGEIGPVSGAIPRVRGRPAGRCRHRPA